MEKKKVISSLAFKFSETFAVKGLGLLISILLARLLAPEEFGQIAIIMVFINLCQTFITTGFSTALVQNKTAENKDYSTVFYINLCLAMLFVAALFFSAPVIGKYYDSPEVIWPLRVYSFSLIFAACNSVQQAKLQREMKFKQSMIRGLITTVLSGIIGVYTAFIGLGLWALIAYYFSNTVISCITLFWAVKWRPRLEFSFSRAKELFSYGWKMLVSGVLCSLYNDIRTLIIGKRFSETDLGYYNRGEQFPSVISNTLDTAIHSVMFPVLAKEQEQKERFREILRKMMILGSSIIIPAMLGLSMVSESFVLIVLTEKWLPCVPFMQVLCLGYAMIPIISSGLIAIKASGRSDVYMKLEIIRRSFMLVILLISVFAFNSVFAIACGFAISSLLDAVIISFSTKKLFNYGFICQIRDVWKTLISSFIMCVCIFLINLLLQKIMISVMLGLILQVFVGALVYVIVNTILKSELFLIVKSIFIRQLIKR